MTLTTWSEFELKEAIIPSISSFTLFFSLDPERKQDAKMRKKKRKKNKEKGRITFFRWINGNCFDPRLVPADPRFPDQRRISNKYIDVDIDIIGTKYNGKLARLSTEKKK